MSKAQNSLPATHAEPGSVESEHATGLVSVGYGENCELGMDNIAALGKPSSLSHSPAPQGRRSLFRR